LNGELSTHTHNNVTLTQPDVKKQDVFIKKEYLPAPNKLLKIEKSREDVSRMLNFVNPTVVEVVTAPPALPPLTNKSGIIVKNETQMLLPKIEVETVQEVVKIEPPPLPAVKIEVPPPLPPPPPSPAKEVKPEDRKDRSVKVEGSATKTSSSSSTSKTSSSHRHSSSSSSHHKSNHHSSSSSSSHKSGSSSHRDCSRCYKRSKIKHANIGIQCRRDSTSGKPLTSSTSSTTTATTTVSDIAAMTARISTANRELNTVSRTAALALASGMENLKYSRFFHIEVHPNGGASFVHMYQDEIAGLTDEEMDELVDEYFQVVFSEDGNGFANHVMGIVHDAAAYLPDLLEHMAESYPNLTVKAGVLGRNSDIETSTMTQYNEQVSETKELGVREW
jgi:lysine-specific demethylase 9